MSAADYSDGGYKDIDINTKILARNITWATRLLDTNFYFWKVNPDIIFSNIWGLVIISHSNLKFSKPFASQPNSYPKFYQDLIQLWADLSEKEPKEVSVICEETLWNNRKIVTNGEALFNKCFIAKGILRI